MAVGLALIFKALGNRGIPLTIAVPLNYLTCSVAGYLLSRPQLHLAEVLGSPWLWLALLQGLFFYTSFSLLALASQRIGLAVAALFSRMAIAAPVMVSFLLLGEAVNFPKALGIVSALVALVLMLRKGNGELPLHGDKGLWLAIVLFALHGVQLSIMHLAQVFYLDGDRAYHAYMALSFSFACLISSAYACAQVCRHRVALHLRYFPPGVLLGLCNYFCVYYLIKALAAPGWGGGQVFPLFSMGVVGGSALAARAVYTERLSWIQWSGLGLGCIATVLITR